MNRLILTLAATGISAIIAAALMGAGSLGMLLADPDWQPSRQGAILLWLCALGGPLAIIIAAFLPHDEGGDDDTLHG